jgi:DNA-binding CsgD family transcriptional regulator
VLIVSAEMQILFANASAEDMLRDGGLISTRMGRLDFAFGLAANAIEHAVVTSKRDEFILGPSGISVPLMRAHIPAVAHVMPLTRRDSPHRVSHKADAAIFISIAGNAPTPAMEAIGALFGLTPAEKKVAAHIAGGKRLSEIAGINGTSEHTVRMQIRTVLDKTSSSGQRDLIRLVADLTPPVR